MLILDPTFCEELWTASGATTCLAEHLKIAADLCMKLTRLVWSWASGSTVHLSLPTLSRVYICFLLINGAMGWGNCIQQLPNSWQVFLTTTLIYSWGPLTMSPDLPVAFDWTAGLEAAGICTKFVSCQMPSNLELGRKEYLFPCEKVTVICDIGSCWEPPSVCIV